MNNTILEVAIGLVFIYLLYSLLATTIKEFIATIFSYRGRMLERGLEQMLDGKNVSFYWWDRITNFFLWLSQWKKVQNSPGGKIDSKTFLSQMVINPPATVTPADPAHATTKDNSTNASIIKRWKLNEKASLFAANITNHPIYTRTAENALFAKKPAYLSADSFSNILIDVLGENKTTGSYQLPSMTDIDTYVKTNLANNPDLQKILNVYIEQANNEVLQFKTLVENWYDSTMNRVSGWYKKQANRILIIIGLCLAIAFNVNTIDIVSKLSVDKNIREAMVKSASSYINTHYDTSHNIISPKKNSIDSPATQKNSPDSSDTSFAAVRSKVQRIKELYDSSIGETNTTMGMGWGDFGYTEKCQKWTDAGKNGEKPQRPGPFQKIIYILFQTFSRPRFLLGFLITAFAISLGAPFWFDLLNRFVNLRASGAKPNLPVAKPEVKKN